MYDLFMNNTIKNKLYQMFILGLEGENLCENPNLIHALKRNLGGVIFFTQNIKTSKQFKKLICEIKEQTEIIPFLSIDQEGGRVERTENLYKGKCFLSARHAVDHGERFLKEQTQKIAELLKDFGINLNFAPVLDVNTNPNNPIIGERAFSNETDEVIKCGKIVVDTYLKNNIIPCTKHFPGHGDASVDSHISLPKIDLSLEEMENIHIKPFKEVESPMIMVAHLHCTAFDKEEIPSSLSENVIGYLRNKLNYEGLLITDDMVMGGVNAKCKMQNAKSEPNTIAALNAINAGINILLYRDSDDKTIKIIENIAEIASKDQELNQKIEASYNKIIEFKKNILKN